MREYWRSACRKCGDRHQLLAQGAVAKGGTPADFAQLIAADRKRYARIIIDNKQMID